MCETSCFFDAVALVSRISVSDWFVNKGFICDGVQQTVLSELANGTAFFEYVETNDDDGVFNGPFASISSAFADRGKKKSLFFARIGASQGTVQAR